MGDKAVSSWLETNPAVLETVTREEWIQAYDSFKQMMQRQTHEKIDVISCLPHTAKFGFCRHVWAVRWHSPLALFAPQHKLTREEWIKEFGNDDMFDAYDNNQDGTLSPEEWLKGVQAEKTFMAMDTVMP